MAMAAGGDGAALRGSLFARLRERARRARRMLIANPRFRRGAADFPLTRGVSRRAAAELFDLTAGFAYTQTLVAFVQSGLFAELSRGSASGPELAARTGLMARTAQTILDAASALRLVEPAGGDGFALGPVGAALVENDGVLAMIEHNRLVYGDLADPVAALDRPDRAGLNRFWSYASEEGPGNHAAYSALMARSQAFVADEILSAYPFGRHRRLMDVGGGTGAFLRAAAARNPKLAVVLFDLPEVVALAGADPALSALGDRMTVAGGSFLDEPLPSGSDVITLNRVLHDHDDGSVSVILRHCRDALPADGRLVISEPMADRPGRRCGPAAYFNLYLGAMGQGRPRRVDEIVDLARSSGFRAARERTTRTPMLVRMVECQV